MFKGFWPFFSLFFEKKVKKKSKFGQNLKFSDFLWLGQEFSEFPKSAKNEILGRFRPGRFPRNLPPRQIFLMSREMGRDLRKIHRRPDKNPWPEQILIKIRPKWGGTGMQNTTKGVVLSRRML